MQEGGEAVPGEGGQEGVGLLHPGAGDEAGGGVEEELAQ